MRRRSAVAGPHDDLARELTEHVQAGAASYEVPSRFLFLDGAVVPTTDPGKISRREIAKLFEDPS
jgi:acyl-coenzyme A synthetase/AMP-(fatty) acid ligase